MTINEKIVLQTEKPAIRVYGKRWLILIIYIAYATLSTLQWVEYSIITNVVSKYYHVSASAVDWTAMSFSIMWPILVFPASFIIDKMGLRVAGLIGAFTTALGAVIKIFSIGENLFGVLLAGQIVVAASQIFILSLPPKIAVTWFKPEEVSKVCSLGIFGMTLGSAMGFLIPPMIVHDSDNLDDIAYDLKTMCWGLAFIIAPVALTVVFYFPAEPPHPPSQTMFEERENRKNVTTKVFVESIKTLLQNKAFMLHTLCYGCIVAIFSSIGTLLNQFILSYFPGAQEDAGRMGLVMILTGMVGSVITGFVLDKTHKYKETAFIIFLLSAVAIVGFALALELNSKWMVYLAIGIFGFFVTAYMPAGIEFATEITFPFPESTVTGILMASSQMLTVIITVILGIVIDKFGTLFCLLFMAGVLLVGTVLTLLTPNILNRQAAFMKEKYCQFTPIKQ
ncbi:unnamed protein product [Psylliodes chrysocephalus]|uniref:Major facilitator superfamily (MFS) profile domain-containing protein n=1 Tax=Psylliodes chrysocephalus TaxID=3402493 RepID=A0A9P0G795_9CUCU|nr:unnamed protein product [Psylliodes chrysocephala]